MRPCPWRGHGYGRIGAASGDRYDMIVVLGALRSANAVLAAAVNVLLCVILALMVIIVGLQISARFLSISMIWTSEVTQYLLLWLTFLGMATVYRSAGHIAVDL